MEECIEAPVTIDKISTTPHELMVLPFPVSDIKKELVQENVQIETEDINDEEFLECIGLTCDDTKIESEGECLESNCSESNLVINEDTFMQIHNKDNQDKASTLADFIESNKLVVDYEAQITREPEIQTVDVAVPFAAKKRKLDARASHRYKCGVCFVRFSDKRKIKQHLATHAESEKCYCNCNGFSIPMSLAELQSHRHTRQYQINTSREKSFKCKECGKAFSTKTSFYEHCAQKSHRCPICTSLTFASCIDVKHHQVIHHSDSFSCTRCGKLFRFLEHYRGHCSSCEYCACEICDRLLESGEILKKHVEMQHLNLDDMFNCPLCDRTFDSSDYDTHDCTTLLAPRSSRVKLPMSVQEGPIKYSWSVAVESPSIDTTVAPDTSEPDLTTFDKLSKSPKRREVKGVYPCEYCDRKYPLLSSLRRHVNDMHTNTKSYWCGNCLKVFRVKCSLDIHKCTTSKKLERGVPLGCPVCQSCHRTAVALSMHIIQYHPELDGNGEVLENYDDTDKELSIDENEPVETVVNVEPVVNVEQIVNTDMRAAELFHMFMEDFEDDLILLNPYDQIEVKDEPKSPEPETYESIDDYLQSTDRIDRIKICVDESSRNSESETMEKTEIIQVIKEEESAEEVESFSEQPNASLRLTPNDEEADKNCTKYNFNYSCIPCKFSKNSFSKYIKHWANHGFDPSECPQCQKKIKTRSDMVSHVNSHIRSIFMKSRVYKVESRTDMTSRSNSYLCKMCNVYVLKPRRYRHWEKHFIFMNKGVKDLKELLPKLGKDHCATEENAEKENMSKDILIPSKKFKYVTKMNSRDGKQKYLYESRNSCYNSVLSHRKKLNLLEKLAATESAIDSEIDIKVEILSDDDMDDVSSPATAACKLIKICTVCNKRFDRVQCLKRHLIEHIVNSIWLKKDPHGEFRCRLCENVSFDKVEMFKRHLRQHADLPMYDCNFCDKSFADSSNYAKHKKVHGLPHMQCDLCKRKFNTKRMLIEHMQYHEKNEPLPCPFCKKVFHFGSNLKKHIRFVHFKVNPMKSTLYPCKHCTLRFVTIKEKWIHQWNAHGVRKNKNDCPVCQSGYRTLSDLRRHLRHSHNIGVNSCDLQNLNNTRSVCQPRKSGTNNKRKLFKSKKN